jgi:cation diffusion facilitator family transporter
MNIAVRAATLSFFSNLFLLILKLVVGLVSGSIAVLSDALDSGEDLVASAAALFSVSVARRPADVEHPYGHGKVETLAAAVEAGVIGLGGAIIAYGAIDRIVHGGRDIDVGMGLGAMAVAAVLNTVVSFYVGRAARATESLALASDAKHLQTNVVQALAVFAALVLVQVTGVNLFDPVVALLLAGYLWFAAFGLLRNAVAEIMDVRLPDDEERYIRDIILEHHPEVRGFHHLRTRRSGRTRYIELHLLVDPARTIQEVHDLCDHLEADIVERLPSAVITIHTEPDDGRYRGPLEGERLDR